MNPQLRDTLEALYARYNSAAYVSPDPLEFVRRYEDARDQEVVGMIASALAFGNVKQIGHSVAAVLARMDGPAETLVRWRRREMDEALNGFRHRFVIGADVAALLWGVKRVMEQQGSLEALFRLGLRSGDETVVPAATAFVTELRAASGAKKANYLLCSPEDGSACKRLNLFLRWMVRKDAVDLGTWKSISPAMLIVPLDTHMHRIALELGFTKRKQTNLRTALEITDAFRAIAPNDPVRYDFALTRLGIRKDRLDPSSTVWG